MNRFVRNITLLIVCVPLLCEFHTVLGIYYPEINIRQYDLWLSKNYHEQITVAYYLYELENILAWVIWFFAFAKVAKLVSYRLFNVILIFVLYFITQLLFYVWNRNTSFTSNLITYLYMALAVIFLFLPGKSKGGKLINLEDNY